MKRTRLSERSKVGRETMFNLRYDFCDKNWLLTVSRVLNLMEDCKKVDDLEKIYTRTEPQDRGW